MHQAVADDGPLPGPQDAAGNQLEDELLLADEDGVAGVVAALVARHDIEALGEEVDNFPLALVSPLGAQDNDVFHVIRKDYFNSLGPRWTGSGHENFRARLNILGYTGQQPQMLGHRYFTFAALAFSIVTTPPGKPR